MVVVVVAGVGLGKGGNGTADGGTPVIPGKGNLQLNSPHYQELLHVVQKKASNRQFFIFRLSWETTTFKNYHSEDSTYSGSRRIEFSSKSTTIGVYTVFGYICIYIYIYIHKRLLTSEGRRDRKTEGWCA